MSRVLGKEDEDVSSEDSGSESSEHDPQIKKRGDSLVWATIATFADDIDAMKYMSSAEL
jgi:hypothetical protein